MSASGKLRIAHFLMYIGVAPMALAAAYSVAVIGYAQSHRGQGNGSDTFLLVVLLLFGYATALVLGRTGALCSWFLTKRRIDERSTATVSLRMTVAAALLQGYLKLNLKTTYIIFSLIGSLKLPLSASNKKK